MNKIGIIIKREYLTRVSKRSFIIMTFLGPILMAAVMIVPVILAFVSEKSASQRNIIVLDETNWFKGKFETDESYAFSYPDKSYDSLKKDIQNETYDAMVYIPSTQLTVPTNAEIITKKQLPASLKNYIQRVMKNEVENKKLLASGIDPEIIKSAKTSINIVSIRIEEDGNEKKTYSEVEYIIGMFLSILIYFFVFLFGSSVMRGIIEEKSSRIVEVIVSSVKPFQLMMGKIVGLALVGLTQFLLWVVLTAAIYMAFTTAVGASVDSQSIAGTNTMLTENIDEANPAGNEAVIEILEVINSINFRDIIITFLIYFLGGYLLYASLFAAVGSAVDNEADSQQFTFPISAPLIIGIVASSYILNDPDGSIAFWLSMFPFTSPIAMMVRIPFGVPYWELVLSVALLIAGFVFTTWMAAKIYRTGILMYGKKVNYKELWKWLWY